MEIYTTEEQQVEAVKQWLKTNGPSIALGIVLGVAAIFGIKWYRQEQINHRIQASVTYEAALKQLPFVPAEKLADNLKEFAAKVDHDGYENLLALKAARKAVDDNALDVAETLLEDVVAHPADVTLEHMARIRLARVQLARQEIDKAKSTVDVKEAGSFEPAYLELKGDIALAANNRQEAHEWYQKAFDASRGLIPTPLRFKLSDTQTQIPGSAE